MELCFGKKKYLKVGRLLSKFDFYKIFILSSSIYILAQEFAKHFEKNAKIWIKVIFRFARVKTEIAYK